MATKLKHKLASKFIVLDGPDGSGKTTQQKLLAQYLTDQGVDVVSVRDPGTTAAGEAIRNIILSGNYGQLGPECELLLFMAARAQMMNEKIAPAIKAGALVLADRFISASCAYQGARDLALESIIQIGDFAVQATWPDLTVVLDVPADLGLNRIHAARGKASFDAMEQRSAQYHQRVRDIFLELPRTYPGKIQTIDAATGVDQVHQRIVEALHRVDF